MPEQSPHGREFLLGLGCACITITTTYPITKLILRKILYKQSTYSLLLEMKKEGITYLFRGILPPTIQKSISLSSMFGIQDEVKHFTKTLTNNPWPAIVIGGVMSGTLEALVLPLERVQLILVDPEHNHRFKNMFTTFYDITKQYGMREHYRSFTVIAVRNALTNSYFFLAKAVLEKHSEIFQYKTPLTNFLFGGILGASASYLFYPFKVVKVIMQKPIGGPFHSSFTIIKQIYQTSRSISVFYTGSFMNAVKAVLGWGVTNASYEYLKLVF